jgi:hypothetical protein
MKFAGMLLALAAGGAVAQGFHTSPSCWAEPRVFHSGPPSAQLANRLRLVAAPTAGEPPGTPVAAPGGVARYWLRQPDTATPGPWAAALIVDGGQGQLHSLLIEQIGGPLAPRWLNERLLFVRVVWGRIQFSDLVLDALDGSLRYHELAQDGAIAFDQFQDACRGRCPCDPAVALSPDDPARFSVDAPLPSARPGAQAMIGLLILPTVFGPPQTGGVVPADDLQPVAIFAEPDDGAAPALQRVALEHFEYREYTYEGAAAVVYDQRPGWYAIGLRDQPLARGWVRAADAGQFLPVAALLRDRLAFLNAHWDGHLWSEPGDGRRTAEASVLVDENARDASTEVAVNILDTRMLGDGLWLSVETLDQSPCNGGAPAVVDRGWIPAYAASGALVAGYYSRGC